MALTSLRIYAVAGYGPVMLLFWTAALVTLAAHLHFRYPSGRASLPKKDWGSLAILAGVFTPVYLLAVHTVPVQVNTDEVAHMTFARRFVEQGNRDPFGLSEYFSFPTMVYLALGWTARLLGGLDLTHMRMAHGIWGVAIVLVGYLLFRQLLPRPWALASTVLLGVNHSLVMISRMGMRDNSGLLIEVVALACLVRGLKHDRPVWTFAGGAAAGLGFYAYYPGRMVLVLALGALAAMALWFRSRFPLPRVLLSGGAFVLACIVVAGPVVIATVESPTSADQPREQFLVFREGRELQRQWSQTETVAEGVRSNIEGGLTAFNARTADLGNIYPNRGHGFVDPLTGALLWVGAGVVLVISRRTQDEPWPVLMLGGFVILWLSFAFLVNKAPNYSRLLITLPFVAYLAVVGLRSLSETIARRVPGVGRPVGTRVLPAAFLAVALTWNGAMAWDFVRTGRSAGDDVGSTGRYIEARRADSEHKFYLAADSTFPYYDWGEPWQWEGWLSFFVGKGQDWDVLSPGDVRSFHLSPPFTIFMNADLWSSLSPDSVAWYSAARVHPMTSAGKRVAIEVTRR